MKISGANIRRRAAIVLSVSLPSVTPDERNETRRRNGATFQRVATTDDEREHLRVSLAYRREQPPSFGQLPK
jgi:hypothetical protein